MWDVLVLKANFAHPLTVNHLKTLFCCSPGPCEIFDLQQHLWGSTCSADGVFESTLCINVMREHSRPPWHGEAQAPANKYFSSFTQQAVKSSPKVIFPKGVCYRVLTFYADTEPAAVYLVAKSKQPAETQFHGLGLIAPSVGLGKCLQKNKAI